MATARRTVTRYPSRTMIFWRGSWPRERRSRHHRRRDSSGSPPATACACTASTSSRSIDTGRGGVTDVEACRARKRPVGGASIAVRAAPCWHTSVRRPAATASFALTSATGSAAPRSTSRPPQPSLLPGLTRELDAAGKPRRDAQGRPFFGPPRGRRFRRGLLPSGDGVPRPFIRHANGAVLIHCPGCGRTNELAEPR